MPEDGLKAKRDPALLCLLVAAGLRWEEFVSLEIGHIQQREGKLGSTRAARYAGNFAKLAHKGKDPHRADTKFAVGHESIQTSEHYLGIQQDLLKCAGDYFGTDTTTKHPW